MHTIHEHTYIYTHSHMHIHTCTHIHVDTYAHKKENHKHDAGWFSVLCGVSLCHCWGCYHLSLGYCGVGHIFSHYKVVIHFPFSVEFCLGDSLRYTSLLVFISVLLNRLQHSLMTATRDM